MSVLARLDDLRAACTHRREVARATFSSLLHETFFAIPPGTIETMVDAAGFHPYAYRHGTTEVMPDHLMRTSDEEKRTWAAIYRAFGEKVREEEYVTFCANLRPTAIHLMDTITLAHEQLGNPLTSYYDQSRPLRPATILRNLHDALAERQAIARTQRYRRTMEITTAVRLLLGQGRLWQEYAHQDVPGHLRAMLAFEHAQWRLLKHRHLESTERLEAVLSLQAEALTNPLVEHYQVALRELTGSDD